MKISEQIKKTENYTVLTTDDINNMSKDIHYLYQRGLVDGLNPCNKFELPIVVMAEQNTKFFTADLIEPPDMDTTILYISIIYKSIDTANFTCSFTVDIDGATIASQEVLATLENKVVDFKLPASNTYSKFFISLYADSKAKKLLITKLYYGW